MAFSQTHFQNAQNLQVHSSQFNNIGPNGSLTIINNPPNSDPVSTTLWPYVAASAIFDSDERQAAGKCHPGTRKKIIERITHWIVDHDSTQRVLWIHGPAGAGKSAIEHTMCELLREQYSESYGASFFFRSGHTDRGNARKLFTTLAYQLAIHFPSIRSQINDALSHDPSLPTKSMEIQFSALIAQPILHCQSLLSCSPILVIDGLDECADDQGMDIQRGIISLIAKYIVEHNLPLRVMVASRPEYWIRDAFDTAPLPSITRILSLRDDVDADRDIEAYLLDGFEKIRTENKGVMASVVLPWPPRKLILHFVVQASGQYVYASTILKFVGKSSRFINPQKQLEIITSPGPHRALAFSELDRLYVTILSAYPDSELETMKRVLGGLLICSNTSIIQVALGVNRDDLALVLDAVSSLIDFQSPTHFSKDQLSFLESIFGPLLVGQDKISFCHRSFSEFLEDETRSGVFHVNLDMFRHEIVRQFFAMFYRNLDQNYQIEPHHFLNLDHITYYVTILDETSECFSYLSDDTKVDLLSQLADRLACFDPGSGSPDSLLGFMGDLERIENVVESLMCLEESYLAGCKIACEGKIRLAWQRAMDALLLCSTFKVTSTLVYFAKFNLDRITSIQELSEFHGTANVISTLRQHRHFLCLYSDDPDYSDFVFLKTRNSNVLRYCDQEKGSLIHAEWNFAQILLAYNLSKLILNGDSNHGHQVRWHWYHCLVDLFDARETSDITTEQYFQNSTNLFILALITDQGTWTRFLHFDGYEYPYSTLIISILCWFNRQLTAQQTLKLLEDYDKALQQRLAETMTFIFERHLLPYLTEFSDRELCLLVPNAQTDPDLWSMLLRVWPLPRGFERVVGKKSNFLPRTDLKWKSDRWQFFLDELLGEMGSKKPAINPSSLHPYRASRLLSNVVKFLYGKTDPAFSTEAVEEEYEESFSLLSQFIPYAEPTPQNLYMIRAIVYLYPESTPAWVPPEDFWRLLGDFLQKYDRSVLSLEELDLFMLWLESTDHADITTYRMIKQ